MDDYAAVLAMLNRTWFGAELAPQTQERLVKLGGIVDFEPDEIVIREGDLSDEFGILLSGRLALQMMVPGQGMITIMSVEPGDVFGWSSVLANMQTQSTVVASEPSKALVLDATKLRAELREDHAMAASLYPRVLAAVARRLRATRLQLLDLFEN
jgi:CRP/FNR family cyclic AMP-dependent transcriptional regulator